MNELGRLELIRESLIAVVNEMRANVIHSSYSSIIYEGHDFSCAVVAADGSLVAQGLADNPLHNFAVPYSTAEVIRAFGDDIGEGDIFLHNDPYTGGTHLNDVLMLFPVFHAGNLALFTATRCHWGDVGGMTPGSISGRVREIYQEGMRIVPTRICERGRMNEAFLDLLFANMRIAHERRGDFRTMLGASRKASEHLQRLFKRFGGEVLLQGINELISKSEKVMRQRIADIPDGTYCAEGYLDSNGHSPEPLVGRLRLTVDGDKMVADFSGSSPQTMGPTNVGPAMALNAVVTVVKSFLDPHSPFNHGSFKPLTVINPPGSFLNARLPAPCGGMVECRALMAGLVAAAVGQALPAKRVGDLKGGGNHVYISGASAGDEMFLLYEYPAGGTGGCLGFDGNHGVRSFIEGDFNTGWSAENLEAQCPIQVEHYGIREGSCGDGTFRGGCGVRRDLRFLGETGSLSVLADKCVIPPYGVATGKGGAANRFSVLRNETVLETSPVPGKVGGFPLLYGDIVRMETAGGGGYGDPLERDASSVASDVAFGYLTAHEASQRYGVAVDAEGLADKASTQLLRKQLRTRRVMLALQLTDAHLYDGPRRRIRISNEIAVSLGIESDDLVELVIDSCGGTLRGWASLDGHGTNLPMDSQGMAVLGAKTGSLVELRVANADPH